MDKVSTNLTKIWLKQAQEDLDDANYLFENGSYKGANNRAYYSIFHVMKAILSLEPTDFKRHKDVIAYFNQNYINTEIFPKKLGHRIKKAEIIRDNSDYNDFYIVSKSDTKEIIETATKLYNYGIMYITNWCKNNNIDFENTEDWQLKI